MFEDIFKRKKVIPSNLLEYGFEQKDGKYQYRTGIMNGEFTLLITIDANDNVDTVLTEKKPVRNMCCTRPMRQALMLVKYAQPLRIF